VTPERGATHEDIIARVRDLDTALDIHKTDASAFWLESRKAHTEIARALSIIGSQVENIEEKVGRVEGKVLQYDRLRDKIIVALSVSSVFLGIIWWMTKDAWAKVFGVSP